MLLFGVIALLVITLTITHGSQASGPIAGTPRQDSTSSWKDSLDEVIAHKKRARAEKELRYQELRDSFARLKAWRELQKQEREMRYQARKDSFAQLKAERERIRAEREEAWHKRQDSLRSIRPQKLTEGEHIDINTTDSLMLIRVPGIGSALSSAILRYRKQLGGFYRIEQVTEVNGVPASVLPYLTVQSEIQEKIEINKLTIGQLRRHPYINFYQAKAIWDYRQKYGNLTDIKKLSLLDEFQEGELERLIPYVSY